MRATASRWNVPSRYGPYGELFFFLVETEPTIREATDDEDDRSFTDEEFERTVDNFMLCAFAHCVCSPHLEDFLLEEMCEVALTCHFSMDVPLSGLSGIVFF